MKLFYLYLSTWYLFHFILTTFLSVLVHMAPFSLYPDNFSICTCPHGTFFHFILTTFRSERVHYVYITVTLNCVEKAKLNTVALLRFYHNKPYYASRSRHNFHSTSRSRDKDFFLSSNILLNCTNDVQQIQL